jgi:hypothetical protein
METTSSFHAVKQVLRPYEKNPYHDDIRYLYVLTIRT